MSRLFFLLCFLLAAAPPIGEASWMAWFSANPILKPTPPPTPTPPTEGPSGGENEKPPAPPTPAPVPTDQPRVEQPTAAPAPIATRTTLPISPATSTVKPAPSATPTIRTLTPIPPATLTLSRLSPTRTPSPAATGTAANPAVLSTATGAPETLAAGRFAPHIPTTASLLTFTISPAVPSYTPTPSPTLTLLAVQAAEKGTDGVLVITAAAMGIFGAFSLLLQRSGFRALQQSQRRQKNLELGQSQAHALVQREVELRQMLAQQPEGWRQILSQLVADALGGSGVVGKQGVLDLSTDPAPRLTVTGNDDEYVFTTRPEMLGPKRMNGRTERAISLDGTLHPAAAVEVQAVWEHLAGHRLREQTLVLPRRSTWFLVVREGKKESGD